MDHQATQRTQLHNNIRRPVSQATSTSALSPHCANYAAALKANGTPTEAVTNGWLASITCSTSAYACFSSCPLRPFRAKLYVDRDT